MTDSPRDTRHFQLSLADLTTEFPRWHCWQGVNKRWYARLLNSSPLVVLDTEDAATLYDEISKREECRTLEPAEREQLKATLDGIMSDLKYVRDLDPIPPQRIGQIAAMLGRLSYELRCAEDMLP